MLIKKLTLHKYKRFFLNRIETLTYEPEKNMQIITGRNSCGKSSLLKELNVLPADLKNEYREGGYKIVEVEHNGETYTLSSGHVGSNKHSIIKNNEELNPGGTRKVQLELIKDIFGITPEIIDILLNQTKLTSMNITDRKRWLSAMSGIDYTYPISVYNALRSRCRDVVGGIKLSQDEIVRESEKVVEEDKYKDLEEAQSKIEEYIEYLISTYNSNVRPTDSNQLFERITRTSSRLSELLSECSEKEYKSLDKISEELEVNKTKLEHLNEKIDKLNKDIDVLNQFDGGVKIDVLLHDQKTLQESIQTKTKELQGDFDLDKIEDYQIKFGSVYGDIISELENLSTLEDVRCYTGELTTEVKTKLEVQQHATRTSSYKIEVIDREINTMLEKSKDDVVKCPNCSHDFHTFYDPDKHKKLEVYRKVEVEKLEKATAEVKSLEELVNKIKAKDETLDRIKNYIRSLPELKELWTFILTPIDFHSTELHLILQAFDNANIVLHHYGDVVELNKRLKVVDEKINKHNNLAELKAKLNIDHKDVLIKDLEKLHEEKTNLINRNAELVTNYNKFKSIQEHYEDLYKQLSNVSNHIKTEKEIAWNTHVTELVNELKAELVKIQATISEGKVSKAKIEQNTKNIAEYKLVDSVLSKVVKELGPTEGLIAKSINSFLNVFVDEMNQVINSIWTYDVELLPCELSEGNDLDYKFRVKINNDEVVNDVAKLSSSMKEVVDLAFRMVFCKYMKLIDMPLYLDEFGATFDSKHRSLAYNVIDKIIGSDYKQVFIVCHYESLYGSLKNVDFNVIDSNNIEVGSMGTYNTCLSLIME